jgi:hypothetical protein
MSLRDAAPRVAGVAGASGSFGALVAAALLPKCPLCVAAWLAALGVGAAWRLPLAEGVRPIAVALAVVVLAAFARSEWSRRQPRARGKITPCARHEARASACATFRPTRGGEPNA